jgi:hypothetical protein
MVLAVSLVCWFRDWFFHHWDAQAERTKTNNRQEAYR